MKEELEKLTDEEVEKIIQDRYYAENPPRKQTEEEKKRAEQFLKEIEEYERKHN